MTGSSCFGDQEDQRVHEGVEVVTAEALVDVFIEPGEKQRVECLRKVVTVVRGTIRV